MPPTYYRGCWHVVSRGLLVRYRQRMNSSTLTPCSSLTTEFYDPKTFFTHAALLRQTCVHCRRFPTAASRRSLGRVSVPVWPITLSGRLRISSLGRPLPHQLANAPRVHPTAIAEAHLSSNYHAIHRDYAVLAPVSKCYPPLMGRLPTCYSPVRHSTSYGECKHTVKERCVRLACIRHAASVRPEPGSNSHFKVCDSLFFTSELTSQMFLLLYRSPAHLFHRNFV